MQSDIESWLTIDEILADVSVGIGDVKLRQIDKGFYVRIVKESLRKLNYLTHFDKRFADYNMPPNLMLPFPSKAFNLRDVFIFNPPASNQPSDSTGTTDCCGVINPVKVYWKAGMATKGKGTGYTANVKPFMNDPFYQSFVQENEIYYFNYQGGMLCFSESCAGYQKVRAYFEGDVCDVAGVKIVPPLVREGITLKCIERAAFYLFGYTKDAFYLNLWKTTKVEAAEPWNNAIYFMKRMSTKERNDLFTYINRQPY